MAIPAPLAADFRIATSREIHSWSFGALTAARDSSATFSDNVRGTLHDQTIFGPVLDFRCFCGKYQGDRYKDMICDRCGVKVAPNSVRGSRFGHIEFPEPIAHPFDADGELQCFPVLPAMFLESQGGERLPEVYDRLIEAAGGEMAARIAEAVTSIVDLLAPVVTMAHTWRLAAATTLARGLALERRSADRDRPDYCPQCGYLLAGLQIILCPGCGTQIT